MTKLLSQAALIEVIKSQFTPAEVEKIAATMRTERDFKEVVTYLDSKKLTPVDRRKATILRREITPRTLSAMKVLADPYIRGDLAQLLPAVQTMPLASKSREGDVMFATEAVTNPHKQASLHHLVNLAKIAADCGQTLPATTTQRIERPKDNSPRYRLNMATLAIVPA